MIQPPDSAYHYTIRPQCETNFFVHGNEPNYSPSNVTVYQKPIPDWVQLIEHPTPAVSENANKRATPYLLRDYQIDIATQTYYLHTVFKIWNVSDLENFSNLSIDFDPAFDTLSLHECKILRNGKWINRLDMNELRIIQKEEDLDANIYSAQLVALLFLEDIREGDILDYSYSVSGSVFSQFSSQIFLQQGCRWEQNNIRIIKPSDRPFQVKVFPSKWNSYLNETNSEITWKMSPSPSFTREPNQPPDFRLQALLEITEFVNWHDVAAAIIPLHQYSDDFKHDAEVLQLVERWKENNVALEEQALQAIQYVQDEIRYTGIEAGMGGFRSTEPLETLKRRFGDCKGKTQLLRAFLDLLDIPSNLCLVNSHLCGSVKNYLPSSNLFDHVILQIDLNNILTYVDSTATYTGGDLIQMGCPFGAGLIVSEKTEDLVTIPMPIVHPEIECHTTFEIDSGDAVRMGAVVHFYGEEANNSRHIVKNMGIDRLANPFQEYIEALFLDVKSLAPVKIEDDRRHNHITLSYTLLLDDPWSYSKKKSEKYISFAPYFLAKHFTQYVDTDRATPLHLTSARIKESIAIKGGYLKVDENTLEHESFTLKSFLKGTEKIEYELIPQLDQLGPEYLEAYEDALDEAYEDIVVIIKRR